MRNFFFEDKTGEKETLNIKIPEKVDPAYGMYVWPCAVVLAQYIWHNRLNLLQDKNVLEIGAGTSLPGVIAAKCGNATSVTLTDDTYQPRSIENCQLSCSANSIPFESTAGIPTSYSCKQTKTSGTIVKIVGLHWGEVPPLLFSSELPYPDIILGSDCFFDESVFEKVLFTIRHLFEGKLSNLKSQPVDNSLPRFLCTYQVRSTKVSLDDLLHMWDLQCKVIPLSEFGADTPNIAKSNMPGNHNIQLLEITMNH